MSHSIEVPSPRYGQSTPARNSLPILHPADQDEANEFRMYKRAFESQIRFQVWLASVNKFYNDSGEEYILPRHSAIVL